MAFPKYENYQDTGIGWIREIPSHWQVKRLKYLVKLKSGCGFPVSEQGQQGLEFPFYKVKHLGAAQPNGFLGETEDSISDKTTRKLNAYVFKENTIVFAKVGAALLLNRFRFLPKRSCIDNNMMGAEIKETLCYPQFLYYFLNQIRVESYASLGTVPSVNEGQISSVPIPFPPFEEQNRISNFLDRKTSEIDQAIALKQRLIELLQEQKAILINQAVTKGLNPNAPMRDSGIEWLSDIPERWQVTRLKRLFLEIDDRSTDGSETLLSLRMYAGLVPHDDVSDKPIEDAALVGYKRVYPGQIVMNRMRAAIGLFGVATDFGIVSPDYAIFRPIKDLKVEYYLNLFKTEPLKRVFFLESKGLGTGSSGFLRLYSDDFGMIKVPFPPLEEQVEICNHIQEIDNQFSKALEKVEQEINLIKELKSIFISQAVTGKIKV